MLAVHDWSGLGAAARQALLARPRSAARAEHTAAVAAIIADVARRGDAALAEYTRRFDGVEPAALAVGADEFAAAEAALAPAARAALARAIANVERFHAAQLPEPVSMEIEPGVRCERRITPIRAVGLYVPAGSAPLPSTAIMLAVPARLARCPLRVLVTPPRRDGRADPAVLAAARLCGIDTVYKAGGAQAIAALAYGTATIPKVDKIFGPGNAWVTTAKQLVAQDPAGAALDLPAGPSEVLVIADDGADATFVAADLLAQAEHDPSAQVLLVTPSPRLAAAVAAEVARQAPLLGRRGIAAAALAHSRLIVVPDLATAVAVSNDYAPEHLLLEVREPRRLLADVTAAGSVFLGDYSPESIGDYCSGTNHVLPTDGHARALSGLSVHDFVRRITVQELSPAGLAALGPVAVTLAGLEGLDAHANAVRVRLERIRHA
jgi:histidinol dehydrogenase